MCIRDRYNRVNAIEEKLEECLRDFVAGLAFYNKMYRSGYELSCKFSDSILTDEESERQQDRQDVSMGVMSHAESVSYTHLDMVKIMQIMISLLEEQEEAVIEYELEETA